MPAKHASGKTRRLPAKHAKGREKKDKENLRGIQRPILAAGEERHPGPATAKVHQSIFLAPFSRVSRASFSFSFRLSRATDLMGQREKKCRRMH
jgi:hypothetical protein